MDNEKYGIELELVTNKFKQKMQEVKSAFGSLTDKKINLKANTAQIEYVKNQIKEIEYLLKQADKGFEVGDVLKLEAQLEKLNGQYNKLIGKQNELQRSSISATNNMTKGLDRAVSKIRRFGLSLLSIRSIWALVSRASSAYLAQDTALANKLQSAWAGLGALLSPIIERIVDLIAKAVKYIAIFIKALTGVDLLAKATAKSMGGTAKAAKSLNKALAGFDELQNLDTDAGGGTGGGIGAGLGGLEDVKIDTKWAERIENFGKWFKSYWPDVLGGFLGFKTALSVLTPLVEKFGLKMGIIKSLGIGLAIYGVVEAIGSLIQYLKDPSWQNFGKIIRGIGIAILGLGAFIGSVPVAVAGAVVTITGLVVSNWEKIKDFFQGGIDWLVSKTDWVKEHFGIVGESIYKIITSALQLVLNIFDNVFKSVKGIFDGFITFIKGVFTGNWKQAWEGIKQIFSNIWNGIKGIVSSVFNFIKSILSSLIGVVKGVVNTIWGIVKGIVNLIISGINILIRGINKLHFDAPDWVPGLGGKSFGINIPQIPHLAVGTNYVPEDQIAMIHKGEAVVPKKFNSKEYFGNSNDETNAILEELIEAVRNIEINPYTTIKDVGKASLNYINNKSRQLGESVVM